MNPTKSFYHFFKALSDANRLKIVGLLAGSSHTVEQLAAALNLGASTVSHHLSRLSEAGLVSARAEGYYSVYKLETGQLEAMSKRLLARDTLTQLAVSTDEDAFERKVMTNFMTSEGRIKDIPAQEKKLLVLVRHIAKSFQSGRRYSEKEVNEIIKQFHPDYASFRRYFISYKLMARENGEYWKL